MINAGLFAHWFLEKLVNTWPVISNPRRWYLTWNTYVAFPVIPPAYPRRSLIFLRTVIIYQNKKHPMYYMFH